MDAGARDRRIAIHAVADSAGSSSFPVETVSPTPLGTVWAAHEDGQGDERFASDQLSSPFNTKWTVPYSAQWDPELVNVAKVCCILWQGRKYDILHGARTGRQHDDIELWTLARQG